MNLARYDGFKHLCHALGLSRRSLVLMLTAYLDVSRGHEPVYVLAGYVASVGHWDRFRREWKRMLSDYGVSVYSAADLDVKKDGKRVGRYKDWSDEKAFAFQKRAFEIIKRHRRVTIGSGIVVRDFYLKLGWLMKEDGSSRLYYTCALDFLASVSVWIRRYKVKDPIQYIFESGDEGYYEIERLFAEIKRDTRRRGLYNLESYTNADKTSVVQLQAAGTWAYECYKQIANQHLDGPKRPVRQSWNALFREYDRPFNTMWDKENLPKLLGMYKGIGGLTDQDIPAPKT
jgi:hypothetical protein